MRHIKDHCIWMYAHYWVRDCFDVNLFHSELLVYIEIYLKKKRRKKHENRHCCGKNDNTCGKKTSVCKTDP